jgi:hypothetical protein
MIRCYAPRRIDYDRSVREVGMRLSARLPLLRKLLAERKLQPHVVQRMMIAIRGDAEYLESTLAQRSHVPGLPEAERTRLRKLARDVKAELARIAKKAGL